MIDIELREDDKETGRTGDKAPSRGVGGSARFGLRPRFAFDFMLSVYVDPPLWFSLALRFVRSIGSSTGQAVGWKARPKPVAPLPRLFVCFYLSAAAS